MPTLTCSDCGDIVEVDEEQERLTLCSCDTYCEQCDCVDCICDRDYDAAKDDACE